MRAVRRRFPTQRSTPWRMHVRFARAAGSEVAQHIVNYQLSGHADEVTGCPTRMRLSAPVRRSSRLRRRRTMNISTLFQQALQACRARA